MKRPEVFYILTLFDMKLFLLKKYFTVQYQKSDRKFFNNKSPSLHRKFNKEWQKFYTAILDSELSLVVVVMI